MEEWITHTLSAAGGAIASGLPLGLWAWSKFTGIRAQQERDDYEMDKVRRSDAYRELSAALEDVKKTFAAKQEEWDRRSLAMNKKIDDLQSREMDCLRKSITQEAQIAKQEKIIEYLEARVKTLEASILPPVVAAVLPGAALAVAVKDVAKEAIAESKGGNPS